MVKKRSKKFVEYLDSYSTTKNLHSFDYALLIQLSNYEFTTNRLQDLIPHANISSTQTPFSNPFQEPTCDIYNIYNNSIWNTTSNYDSWQQTHEITLNLPPLPKKKVVIDMSFQTIADMIHIIDTYPCLPDTEYNFDVKAMHSIREELIALNHMIGMTSLKRSILGQLIYFIQGLHLGKSGSDFKHTVLHGSPGTGKTEIAKIIGKMYSKLGILKNNVFKKVTRNDLVAGYLGQTAIKTKKVIDECLGGVLFIDEAYSLANTNREDSYSKECLDTLCEALSDHKDDLMVIIAGYEDELNDTFFKANRGLESRFIWKFKMDPYGAKELSMIFQKMVADQEWEFDPLFHITHKWFEEKKDRFKHYGRDMELLFTYVKMAHGLRIYGKPSECRKKITGEDMNAGFETFVSNKQSAKPESTFMHTIYV